MEKRDEMLGLAEVAALLGWEKEHVSTYIRRGKFPEPAQRVKATPLWTRQQIEEYMQNRKKPSYDDQQWLITDIGNRKGPGD